MVVSVWDVVWLFVVKNVSKKYYQRMINIFQGKFILPFYITNIRYILSILYS